MMMIMIIIIVIIITNVIILELSARCVYPGDLLPFYFL